jgi:hypothetical protein
MNRDEGRSRGSEVAPALRNEGDTQWAAPADSDSGGTWMGVNSHGVVACLLNGYAHGDDQPDDASKPRHSRGAIIPSCLPQGPVDSCQRWITDHLDPLRFQSFTLLIATPQLIIEYQWQGSGKLIRHTHDTSWTVKTSSSWRTQEVLPWREAQFADWLAQGAPMDGALPTYHLKQVEGMAEWSVLMERPLACTRSITQAALTTRGGAIELRHWPIEEGKVQYPSTVVQVPPARSASASQ